MPLGKGYQGGGNCQWENKKTLGTNSKGFSLGVRNLDSRLGGNLGSHGLGGGGSGNFHRLGIGGGGDVHDRNRDVSGRSRIGGSRIGRSRSGSVGLLHPEGIDERLASESGIPHGFGSLGQPLDHTVPHPLGVGGDELDERELGATALGFRGALGVDGLAGFGVHVIGDHEIPQGPFSRGGEAGDVVRASGLLAVLGGLGLGGSLLGNLGLVLAGLGGLISLIGLGVIAHVSLSLSF